MSKKTFEKIARGLQDAIAFSAGIKSRGRTTLVSTRAAHVALARRRLGMSQREFSVAFAVPISTLRKWEQGERSPTGAARVLLRIITREPEAVLRAVASR